MLKFCFSSFLCYTIRTLKINFSKNMERTFVMIKPDALQRGLVGETISRLEKKGLKMVGCKMMMLGEDTLKEHYAHLADKPFFPGIVKFMQSAPVVVTVWEGLDVIETVRTVCGVTKAREAAPGTIRGDLAMSVQCNIVHASDGAETAKEEVGRMFEEGELFEYNKEDFVWVYSEDER